MKFARQRRITRALAVVPFTIDLGHGMNVMRDRIGVRYLELLAGLNA